MEIFNRGNSKTTGDLPLLRSWMLISPQSSSAQGLSMQISEIPVGSAQPVHHHEPEQCYYIIRGKGLMLLGEDAREVSAGDAVHIPSHKMHGIRNAGDDVLEYLTANSPPFSEQYENTFWPAEPEVNR